MQWWIQARGPPLLFLDQTEAQKAEKFFWVTTPPLSKGLDDCPYLKFWIQHCYTSPGLADTTFFAGCDMHLSFKAPENILLPKNFYMYTKFFYFEQKFDF